ncbi:MAG: hypothetical protein LC745_11090 [Planctomycetia bacterium]|nr:hypothetical protein [Planctomycetia bacterium]
MSIFGGCRKGLFLALALALIAAAVAPAVWLPARAQQLAGADNLAQPLPPTPPQGAWGEVIMANRRWMVVQNHYGQQFPIDMEAIAQFLIRWPTRLDALTGDSRVEAIGPDLGSNTLATDHVDVFEGADRDLVQPTFNSLLPNNRPVTTIDPGYQRFMNPFDIGSQNLLHGWAYPVSPGMAGIPARLHVVGNVFNVNPLLQVSVQGNNFATIVPGGDATITRVTRGNTSFAEKGDLVFLMPTNITMRTVVLSQAVLYKRIPITQFRAP